MEALRIIAKNKLVLSLVFVFTAVYICVVARKFADVKCSVCKGSGMLPAPYLKQKNAHINNIVMAKLLNKEGYSLRQIGRFLGYASPRSVQLLIQKP